MTIAILKPIHSVKMNDLSSMPINNVDITKTSIIKDPSVGTATLSFTWNQVTP
jgi:hypothetical protein